MVAEWADKIRKFSGQEEIKIILNVGGAVSSSEAVQTIVKEERFEYLAEALEKFSSSPTKFLPQTMPPYPWHFGGQGFAIVVNMDDISISAISSNDVLP